MEVGTPSGCRGHAHPGWPPGVWTRHEADVFGLVIVRDLPRDRSTLMLRLMGAGAVQAEAIKELERLPDDAWERAVAIRHLVAFRFQLPQDRSREDREYLMSTEDLYESWLEHHQSLARKQGMEQGLEQGRTQGLEQGRTQGLRRSIRTVYETRFGPMPAALLATLDTTEDLPHLEVWLSTVALAPAEEIAATLKGDGDSTGA